MAVPRSQVRGFFFFRVGGWRSRCSSPCVQLVVDTRQVAASFATLDRAAVLNIDVLTFADWESQSALSASHVTLIWDEVAARNY